MHKPVPVIPHGQNWELALPPNPQISQVLLSLDEFLLIVPAPPRLLQSSAVYEIGTIVHKSTAPKLEMLLGILVAAIFLIAGFDLIPRVHAGTLRLRSLHLRQNLFN